MDADTNGGMHFPTKGLQVLSCLVYILGKAPNISSTASSINLLSLGVSVLSDCFSRRLASEELSLSAIRSMSWARMAVLLVFFDSWLFLFASKTYYDFITAINFLTLFVL